MSLRILFILFSIFVAVIDIKYGKIPRLYFLSAFIVLIILLVLSSSFSWLYIAGAITGLAVFILAFLLTNKKLGLADVWYSGLIGFVLGLKLWYVAISAACLLGILFILIFKKHNPLAARIPFIPFMAAGSTVVIILEGKIQ